MNRKRCLTVIVWCAVAVATAGLLTVSTLNVRAQRDRGVNQPGAVGNRGGRDPGVNQPGAAGIVGWATLVSTNPAP